MGENNQSNVIEDLVKMTNSNEPDEKLISSSDEGFTEKDTNSSANSAEVKKEEDSLKSDNTSFDLDGEKSNGESGKSEEPYWKPTDNKTEDEVVKNDFESAKEKAFFESVELKDEKEEVKPSLKDKVFGFFKKGKKGNEKEEKKDGDAEGEAEKPYFKSEDEENAKTEEIKKEENEEKNEKGEDLEKEKEEK